VTERGPDQTFTILNRYKTNAIGAIQIPSQHPDPTSRIAEECGLMKVCETDEEYVDTVLPRVHLGYYTKGEKLRREFDLDRPHEATNRGMALCSSATERKASVSSRTVRQPISPWAICATSPTTYLAHGTSSPERQFHQCRTTKRHWTHKTI
jgi:hypothetical protein